MCLVVLTTSFLFFSISSSSLLLSLSPRLFSSQALVRIARKAKQVVPDWLAKFESAKAAKQWRVEDADKALAAINT